MVFSKCQVQQSWIQGLTPGINPFFAFTFTSGKGLHRVGHDWSDLAAAAAAAEVRYFIVHVLWNLHVTYEWD